MTIIVPTLFDAVLTDIGSPADFLSKKHAEQLFIFFQHHPLFNWKRAHNGCEGRADAACVLLEGWGIPNYKAWVFSGAYLKNHIGGLKNNWNYHVAPAIPVMENGRIVYYVIDPATGDALQTVDAWAAGVTQLPHSYHFIRQSHWYIFPDKNISTKKWNTRNRQNRKWMIQCLAGINGLSAKGKARLCFNKPALKKMLAAFEQAKRERFAWDAPGDS
jgi:hypothetical protein